MATILNSGLWFRHTTIAAKTPDDAPEIAANIARIKAVRFDVLPRAAARNTLISLAWHCCDVDA